MNIVLKNKTFNISITIMILILITSSIFNDLIIFEILSLVALIVSVIIIRKINFINDGTKLEKDSNDANLIL